MPIDTEKHLTKSNPFMIKKKFFFSQLGMKENFPNLITSTKNKVKIIFNGEINTDHLLPNTKNKIRISLSPLQFNVIQ